MSTRTIIWAIIIGVVAGLIVEWIMGRTRGEGA